MNTLHERLAHSTFSLPLGGGPRARRRRGQRAPAPLPPRRPRSPADRRPVPRAPRRDPPRCRAVAARLRPLIVGPYDLDTPSPPTPSPHRSPRRPGRPRRPRLGRRYHPHRVRRRDLALIDRLWHAWSPSFTLDSARRAQERGLHHVGAGRFALALEARTLERGRNSSPVYNVSKLSPGISLGLLEPV